CRGEYRTSFVAGGSPVQAPPAVQLGDVGAKLLVDVPVIFFRPHLPVGDRAAAVGLRALPHDQVLAIGRYLAQPRAHADPVRHETRLVGGGRAEVETDRAVD